MVLVVHVLVPLVRLSASSTARWWRPSSASWTSSSFVGSSMSTHTTSHSQEEMRSDTSSRSPIVTFSSPSGYERVVIEPIASWRLLPMDISILGGDIVEQHVDAVVNAANNGLLGAAASTGRSCGPAVRCSCRRDSLVGGIGSLPPARRRRPRPARCPPGGSSTSSARCTRGARTAPTSCVVLPRGAARRRRARGVVGRVPRRVRRHPRLADRRRCRCRRADRCIHTDQRRGRALRVVERRGAGPVPTGARRALVMTAPPERIEPPGVGVVLRRYVDGDVDALDEAVESSRDHLRPHMPWADEAR